jgi:hypothetical protein
MTLVLDLNPELELKLRHEADARGLTLEQLVLTDLQARVALTTKPVRLNPARLNPAETALMQTITEGLPEAFWTRYRHLISLREQETLTEPELGELITCSDRVEHLTARRVEALVELASLRGLTVQTLLAELDLKPVPTAT